MIILTNMCLLIKDDTILVQNRIKSDWPGLTLPGGKVKINETIYESVIREFREETNLELINPDFVNYIEWNIKGDRHLCMLFKCQEYQGEIKSSIEGECQFMKISDLSNNKFSTDFDKILDLYGIIY